MSVLSTSRNRAHVLREGDGAFRLHVHVKGQRLEPLPAGAELGAPAGEPPRRRRAAEVAPDPRVAAIQPHLCLARAGPHAHAAGLEGVRPAMAPAVVRVGSVVRIRRWKTGAEANGAV